MVVFSVFLFVACGNNDGNRYDNDADNNRETPVVDTFPDPVPPVSPMPADTNVMDTGRVNS